ncbi:hypothetical protein GCK72_013221 [Caenorhabditis remanei]|uniref:Uncharacterized protein n=1 Tax=Caenorhabditis remanei TaxID=31234 RepID=A0A6A5GN97_CAERE|nr:hypothetical protein GCK72_013221 [Caenorhabditis remanei]KAF1756767.1 hypothetical protein GCK72_013221 [Caenorhabditis remanei]
MLKHGPPSLKRALTDSDIIDGYVAYEDYRKLYDHVVKLTHQINELQSSLMESASAKVSERLTDTCPILPDPFPIGQPVSLIVRDDVFTDPSTNTKSYANAALNGLAKPIDTLSIAKEAAKIMDKATRAVVERMPDNKEDPDQEKLDLVFFTKFSTTHGLPVPSEAHRHFSKTACRPLKLQFANNSERDKFLHGFYKVKNSDPSLSSIHNRPRARRDLTKEELKRLYESRKFVYDNNLKEKSSKYIMVDIDYKLNRNPRPFI